MKKEAWQFKQKESSATSQKPNLASKQAVYRPKLIFQVGCRVGGRLK